MPNVFKREWLSLKSGAPGSRFQERYAAAKAARRAGGWAHHAGRVVRLLIAIVALAIGVVLMFIPGPAVLFYFLAGSLLAAESELLARGLDWSEIKLRRLARATVRRWHSLSAIGKVAIIAVTTMLIAGGAVGVWRWWLG